MAQMTNVALATPVSPNFWTLIYTAAAAVVLGVNNRTPDSDVLIRVNGAAGLVNDPSDAPADTLHPLALAQYQLNFGDLVYARLANVNPAVAITGRVNLTTMLAAVGPGKLVAVTPSNSVDLPNGTARGLLVGTAGAATINDNLGNQLANVPLQQGYNPILVNRVFVSSLSAANIWAIY